MKNKTTCSEIRKFEKLILNIAAPGFSGFYNSLWEELDGEEDCKGMYHDEGDTRPTLDYRAYMAAVGRYYTNYFRMNVLEKFAINKAFTGAVTVDFDRIDSPKEYNFRTDRIMIKLGIDVRHRDTFIGELIGRAEEGDYPITKTIKENYSSCDGFISFLSNDWNEWVRILSNPETDSYGVYVQELLGIATDADLDDDCYWDACGNGICDASNYLI